MNRLARIFHPKCTRERILVLCWLAYTLAYLLRVNLAAVIPALMAERQLTYAQMGGVTSLFFITYMFGQLVSGWLGDRYSGKRLILTGLAVSSLCNAGMVLTQNVAGMAVVWAINGLAQSLLWAPIMKTLSVWFPARHLERVSYIISMSMIVGYAASWGFSSALASLQLWPVAFWGPALLGGFFLLIMILTFKSRPEQGDTIHLVKSNSGNQIPDNPPTPEGHQQIKPAETTVPDMFAFFRLISLAGLMLIAVAQGVIREGISTWFPAIIESSTRISSGSPWLILAIVPIVNLGGIVFVRRISMHYKGDSKRTLLLIFALATAAAGILNLLQPQWTGMILAVMMLLLSLTYGLTPILTSVIPFQYARFKRVSLTAGVLDFSIYVGAAFSSLLSGLIADRYSWSGVMVLWFAAAAIGLLLSIHRKIKLQGRTKHEQDIHTEADRTVV